MYGGLVTRKQQEALRATKEVEGKSSSTPETTGEYQLNLAVMGVHTSVKNTGTGKFNSLTKDDGEKELIEKVFHDNAIQELIEEFEQSQQLNHDVSSFKIGDYVLFTEKYDMFDIDFLQGLFSKKTLGVIARHKSTKDIGLNREQRRAQKKAPQPTFDQTDIDLFDAVCKIIPCKKMIVTKDHFIPLDERFLRESLQNICFKYGNTITVLGRITNTPKAIMEDHNIINPSISHVVNAANASLFSFISASVKWIVTPIALFFE